MGSLFRHLGRNLWSGARLVFGQPVTRLDFRIDVPQLLLLFLVSALLDILVEGLQQEHYALFTYTGLVGEGFYGAVLMLFAALLALAFRQPDYALVLPVVVLSGEWPLQAVRAGVSLAVGDDVALFGTAIRAEQVLLAWTLFWLWRSAAVSLAPRRPYYWLRSLAAGAILATPLWFGAYLFPDALWWEEPEAALARDDRYPSPAAEEVLVKQPELLYDALNDLEEERPGVTDLYFVGFASYAGEDVFRKDMDVAQQLFDERFDTDGRSIVLVNNPATVLEQPLATASNLRASLSVIGDTIDPEQDVVMVYLTSHGNRDHSLAVQFPPLELDPVTPDSLKQMLDDAGIKWRIIVVSACYSGGFVEPLADEYTLVITSSGVDAPGFGCDGRAPPTLFGDAFFQQGLGKSGSFEAAFEVAKARVAERESAAGYAPPSDPQWRMGEEMAEKLKSLRKRGGGGATVSRKSAVAPG